MINEGLGGLLIEECRPGRSDRREIKVIRIAFHAATCVIIVLQFGVIIKQKIEFSRLFDFASPEEAES